MLGRFKLKAGDSRSGNVDVMALVRDELAKQQGHRAAQSAAVAHASAGASKGRKPGLSRVDPAEVISLDDGNFGKF